MLGRRDCMRKSGYALNYWFCMDFCIIMAMSVKFSFFWQSGERVRLAYEKKCTQLQNQESKGDDPSTLEKTKATLRDLHTQIKVSIHSIEAISKRIETLRDEELHPQLLELVQGYVTSLLFPSFSLGYFVLKSAYRTVNLYKNCSAITINYWNTIAFSMNFYSNPATVLNVLFLQYGYILTKKFK